MAATHIASACAAGTSITIPAHVAGDLLVMFAYKDGATSLPIPPAAGGTVPTWHALDTSTGANLNSAGTWWAIAAGTTDTSGTWTGATGLAISVVRGADPTTPMSSQHGQSGSAASSGGALSSVPTISPTVLDGSSLFLTHAGWRTVTAWGAAPSGWTQQAQVATETVVYSKNDPTIWAGTPASITGTASGNGGYRVNVMEILSAPSVFRRPTIVIPRVAVMGAATR